MSGDLFKFDLLEERGRQCELCGKVSAVLDLDHAIVSKKKGHPELDDEKNYIVLCRNCHFNKKKGWEYIKWAWRVNCARYGRLTMIEWLKSVDLITKPTVESLES